MTDGPKPVPPGSRTARKLLGMPATHVVPAVASIVSDVFVIIKAEVDAIRRRAQTQGNLQALSREDAAKLESLVRSLKTATDIDGVVAAELARVLPKATDEELERMGSGDA